MGEFQVYHRGRLHVHLLQTTQFRTRHLSLKICRPLHRDSVTKSAMIPYLWMDGTSRLPSPLDIARYSDELFGALIRTNVGKRGPLQLAEVYASVPEESRAEEARGVFDDVVKLSLELATDPLRGPTGFSTEFVKREKSLHQKRIASQADDKIAYAMEQCTLHVCRGLPEGLPRLGFEEDIEALTPAELWAAHEQLLKESDVYLYIVGDIKEPDAMGEQLLEQLERQLPAASAASATSLGSAAVSKELVRAIPADGRGDEPEFITERQQVQQGKLNFGFRTGVSYDDEDYPALLVANGILGGFPHSKLFRNVREKESLAYYASSRLDGLSGIVAIQTGIEPGVAERAQQIILEQVDAMKQGDVSDEELHLTQGALANQYRQVMDQPVSRLEIHFSGTLAGIDRDVETLMKRMHEVSREDVVRASNRLRLDTVYFLSSQEGETHGN